LGAMTRRKLISFVALAGTAFVAWCIAANTKPRLVYTFETALDSPFLSEETALKYSRRAIANHVENEAQWIPLQDERTQSPDGRRDRFLARNSLNPNRGVIVFKNMTSGHVLAVTCESYGQTITCEITDAK
jgi:hypothetical protein